MTKIGNVNTLLGTVNNDQNNIVVLIGGITNIIESNLKVLKITNDPLASWSIVNNLVPTYNTWYIAQSNLTAVQKNAYNVGIALDSIRAISIRKGATIPEIHVICHSKGGLEMRLMMDGKGEPMKISDNYFNEYFTQNPSNPFSNININGALKSVTFLGTPHQGISDYAILGLEAGNLSFKTSGLKDLTFYSKLILYLKKGSKVPPGIRIANITGHHHPKFGLNQIGGDGGVPQLSSENPEINGGSVKKQYYLKSNLPFSLIAQELKILHTYLHTSYVLNDKESACLECLSFGYASYICNKGTKSTMSRIIALIENKNISDDCPKPDETKTIRIGTWASILSNSKISIKKSNEFLPYAFTDENGFAEISLIDISVGDTLKIDASGYEPLIFAIDSSILSSRKIDISMIKSILQTNKIKYPSLKLVNQNPVTKNSIINIESTGENVISYAINSPFNQDTAFIPLTLSNNQFIVQLDTGYNQILVRFIGQQDTVTLGKEVYYLPDSLMNQNTYNTGHRNIILEVF